MKQKHQIAHLTAPEFQQRMADNPVIIIPLGSIEQHGPACPMGDYLLTEALANDVAAKSGALVVPTLPFGHANYFKCVPGGVSISTDTLMLVVRDICEAYLQHGLEKIVILNGHGGNFPWVREITEHIYEGTGVMIPSINLWGNVPQDVWEQAFPNHGKTLAGHGAEPIASLHAYLFPHLLEDSQKSGWDGNNIHKNMPITGMSTTTFQGMTIQHPFTVNDVNPTGVTNGQGTLHANARSGEIIFTRMSQILQEFITTYHG